MLYRETTFDYCSCWASLLMHIVCGEKATWCELLIWMILVWTESILLQPIPLSFSSPMVSRWYRALQPAWWCARRTRNATRWTAYAGGLHCAGTRTSARTRACRMTNQIIASNLPETPKCRDTRVPYASICVRVATKTPEPFVYCVHLLSFDENCRLKT